MKKLLSIISVLFFLGANAATTDTVFVNVGNTSKSAFIYVVDKKTGENISASVTNIVIQNSNPSVLNITNDARSIDISPIASGNGTATVSCHVVFTDLGDGLQKSEDKQIVIAYSVTYNPPNGATLKLTFN